MARKQAHEGPVLVIGLGRFGGAMCLALQRLGHEVLAVDMEQDLVQLWSSRLTHVVQADATSEDAMRQLGAADFTFAVVAIGTDIESSILTASVLTDLGVQEIWAKAITSAHGRILERIGARHVVFPEAAMGERVAHLLSGKMIDYIEFDDGFTIVKTRAPRESIGHSLGQSRLRSKYGITVVGVKRPGQDFTYATQHTDIEEGDLLIVCGANDVVETFAAIV